MEVFEKYTNARNSVADDNEEGIWKAVKEAFSETANVFLGMPSSRASKEWLSTTTLEL